MPRSTANSITHAALVVVAALLVITPTVARATTDSGAVSRGNTHDQPTLDELLDLAPPTAGSHDDTTVSPTTDPAIDPDALRRLEGHNPIDTFDQAVDAMADAADRLGDKLDPGLPTQRQQEKVLASLDHVIAAAKQNGSSFGGSAGSGGSSADGSKPASGGSSSSGTAGQSPPGSGQSAASQSAGAGSGGSTAATGGSTPPSRAGGADSATGPMRESRTEWGNLPPRLRDQLQQGLDEHFSAIYRALTEQYYRRLAEDHE